MEENKLETVKEKDIDLIGYQIPNPENYTKHMIAKLISNNSEQNFVKKQVEDLLGNLDVSKTYFLSPGDKKSLYLTILVLLEFRY